MTLAGMECFEEERRRALNRGTNQYTMAHIVFLREEFALMVEKGQWVVLNYSVAKELPGLRIIPTGVKGERYQRPRWLGDYSYSNINHETLPIATLSAI